MRKVEYTYNNEIRIGTFHEWGMKSIISNKGILNLTRAIVETEDGIILMIDPKKIKFIDKENKIDLLEKFKNGDIGVKISNIEEYNYVVKLYEEIFPNGFNYNTEEDIDDFPIIRVDGSILNGYWDTDDKFNIIEYDKFKESICSQ